MEDERGGGIPFKVETIDSTLVRRREVNLDTLVVQIDLVAIGRNLLLVIMVADDRLARCLGTLTGAEAERRPSAMTGHDEWQPVQAVARIVVPLGIDAQDAVRQVHRRVGRHQQVADVSHIGVHVVHRLTCFFTPCFLFETARLAVRENEQQQDEHKHLTQNLISFFSHCSFYL